MWILAFETSTPLGSVALLEGDSLQEEVRGTMAGRHAIRLLDEADRMLALHGLDVRDVDLFVASRGPGSFTGLRVGLATVKGLAFATGRPAAGVSSLLTLAWPHRHAPCALGAVLDARKNEVYAALYRPAGGVPVPLLEEDVAAPARWATAARSLLRPGEPILLVGDGALLHRSCLQEILGSQAWFADAENAHPRASVLGILGRAALAAGEAGDPVLLDANYIRPSEAETRSALLQV